MYSSVLGLLLFVTAILCADGYDYFGFVRHAKVVKRETRPCDSEERYRQPSGRCNNLANPDWGVADLTMPRWLPNTYPDGVGSPRVVGKSGNVLPNPRSISLRNHGPSDAVSNFTLMVMQFGQFLGADFVFVARAPAEPDCCVSLRPECDNIDIPPEDDYFTDSPCMAFQRSIRVTVDGVEEQTNGATAYIDASHVYGTTDEQVQHLRGEHGQLRVVNLGPKGDFLPEGPDHVCRNETGEHCFVAGSSRVNQVPGLAALHNVFMREHNRIARGLKKRFDWDSDRIFEETRKIIGAEIQHIAFNEYIPILLGPDVMTSYGLRLDQPFTYRNDVNSDIRNEFAAAAYRFGHSLVPEAVNISGKPLEFRHMYVRPGPVLDSLDGLIAANWLDRAFPMDRKFSYSVSRHLFQPAERRGTDLVARNIQRGRDHGLQPLNEYRKFCSLDPYRDLAEVYPGDATAQATYQHVDDVDLYSGAVSEQPVEGGLVGPLFACLLGRQFSYMRNGDRFFYLNREGPQAFTEDQITEIQKIGLNKVICENTENKQLPETVFRPQSDRNPIRDCFSLPDINLDMWKD